MSNLYKAQINQSKDGVYTRVIDHNELLEQKLSAISFEQEQKLRQQRLAQGGADLESADQEADSQGHTFSEGLFAAKVETAPELEIDFVEKAKEEAAEITAKATADAEEILKRAVQEAEDRKSVV